MSDDSLRAAGARRYRADRRPGFPDRVELRDANIGESLILVNFEHQPAQTPYRASHAIFVLEGAMRAHDAVDEIPEVLTLRPISLRGFDATGWMIDADLASGHEVRDSIMRLLGDERVAYVHAHYAKPGCYAARIDRA
jgi:hypothetical protein